MLWKYLMIEDKTRKKKSVYIYSDSRKINDSVIPASGECWAQNGGGIELRKKVWNKSVVREKEAREVFSGRKM
jgi:hypothetical protein